MTLVAITPQDALKRVAQSLGVPAAETLEVVGGPLIGQSLRRAIQIMAPCASHELLHAVESSLARLPLGETSLSEAVAAGLETLIVYGDILELRPVEVDDWRANKLALRPAPASFVRRADGSIVVLGAAGDTDGMLLDEQDVSRYVSHHGYLRFVDADHVGDLAPRLLEIGFLELSERAWLRAPPIEKPQPYVERWRTDCAREPRSHSPIQGLRILDGELATSFYRDRWTEPTVERTGLYVGRRPQRYGADIWCVVEMKSGTADRFLDITSVGDRVRPCDIAWRIQMAMDAARNKPQRFRSRALEAGCAFDFFSPVPSWAERRLALIGDKLPGEGCLFSYKVPAPSSESEAKFLADALWLAREAV